MICAVMSNSLNSIMLSLKDAIDSQHKVTNQSLFRYAISSLEKFPMTMAQLQETRIGGLLNKIRHNLDNELQKRVKSIIRKWRVLLEPNGQVDTVVPIPGTDNLLKSSTEQQITNDISHLNNNNNNSSRKRLHFNASTPITSPNSNNPAPPNRASKLLKQVENNHETVLNTIPTNVVNHKPLMNGRVASPIAIPPVPATVTNATQQQQKSASVKPLAKVKSTADLLRTAGDCIDSATAEKILTNRLQKQVDDDPYRPAVTSPVASVLKPVIRKSQIVTLKQPPLANQSNMSTKKSPNSKTNGKGRPGELSDGKSEMMAKFLASSSSETAKKPQMSALQLGLEAMKDDDLSPPEAFSEKASREQKKHKKAKKQRNDDENQQGSSHPPVTNFMDRWPKFPALPQRIVWDSLERPDTQSHVHYQIPEDPTEMFTVPIGEIAFHVLPWVDMTGERKKFFPENSANELEKLLASISNPW